MNFIEHLLFNDEIFYSTARWQLKLSLIPRRCDLSKKLIWFKYGYQGTIYYKGNPSIETRWLTKSQYIIERLKGNLL